MIDRSELMFERSHGVREEALEYLALAARNYPPIHAALIDLLSLLFSGDSRSRKRDLGHPALSI